MRSLAVNLLLGLLAPTVIHAQQNLSSPVAWRTGNSRVDSLILALSSDEKISLVGGATSPGDQDAAGYVRPVPRLGIPAIQLSDGEAGINVVANATAIPVQLNVAATWSRDAAFAAGLVTGREAKLLNMSVALAPRVNLLRDPFTGNFWQSYSEDPFLNGQLGVQGVWGIQSQGAMADAKQIGPSSTGASSGDTNSIVDLQTLYEVYWAPHGELLDAGAATLMCSYAQVNGIPACQHPEIYKFVREVHNWTGIMMSDWTATHSTAPSIEAGLDLEMPTASYYGQPLYNDIYVYHNLSESYLNRAVGHILLQYDRFGLLNNQSTSAIVTTTELSKQVENHSAQIAYDIAVKSGVLLKNNGALPLKKNASIAVIGPNGLQYTNGAPFAERAWGFPERRISVLQGLQQRLGNVTIPTSVGVDLEGTLIPTASLVSLNGTAGLSRNDTLGNKAIDSQVNFSGADALPANRSYTWQGSLRANESGLYRISLQREFPTVGGGYNNSDYSSLFDTAFLYINGTEVAYGYRLYGDGGIRPWSSAISTRDGWDNIAATVWLDAGLHPIEFTVESVLQQPLSVKLNWVTPSQREADINAAVKLAKSVDTPLLFAFAQSPAAVGMRLEAYMDELVSRVTTANPNTVVILNNAEPVLMPWLNTSAAVLEMMYPGQEQGFATADLLLGNRTPQGRLPVTYPASINSTVTRNPKYPGRVATADGNATFSEGVNAAYRWYQATNTSVLFPLGYGLSYTTFSYSDLSILTADKATFASNDTALAVSFSLTNTGNVAGAEVPQLYLLPQDTANTTLQVAAIQLAGFESVELVPGETKFITLEVPRRKFEVFDPEAREWNLLKGKREVWIAKNAQEPVSKTVVEV